MIGILARPMLRTAPANSNARAIPDVATIPCTVSVGNTADGVYAHVDLLGVLVGPGDTVIVHGAPDTMPFGRTGVFHCRATVLRAGPVLRAWTKATAWLGLTELYEVSFSGERI